MFKKINFHLHLKGMTITDWINSVSYDATSKEEIRTSDLIQALESMGVRL